MTRRIVVVFSAIALLVLLVPAVKAAPARQVEFPPFNWSTAQWDPTNGGYCNAGGMCALPHSDLPPGWGQECTTSWCTYPSNDLALALGIEGGLGGEGRGCDYSTDCFTSWGTNILPPPAGQCPSTWPICAVLYPASTPEDEHAAFDASMPARAFLFSPFVFQHFLPADYKNVAMPAWAFLFSHGE